jgi:hypothetical protein
VYTIYRIFVLSVKRSTISLMSLYLEDHNDLKASYQRSDLKVEGLSTDFFPFRVGQRMFIEANFQRNGRYKTSDSAEMYHQWIEDEGQFEKERMEARGECSFHDLQRRITDAVVRRAVVLFRSWEGKYEPLTRDDRRNLRCDLQPYLDRENKITASSIMRHILLSEEIQIVPPQHETGESPDPTHLLFPHIYEESLV